MEAAECIFIYVTTVIKEKEAMNLRQVVVGIWEGLKGGAGDK